jgi:hypothetical protein
MAKTEHPKNIHEQLAAKQTYVISIKKCNNPQDV